MHSRVPGHFQRTLRAWGSRWPVSAFGNVGRSATFAAVANCRSFESPAAAALKCHLVHKQNYYASQSGKFHGCRVVRRLIYERMNIFEGIRCAVLEMWFTMAQVSFHCLVHFCVQKFWRGLCAGREMLLLPLLVWSCLENVFVNPHCIHQQQHLTGFSCVMENGEMHES